LSGAGPIAAACPACGSRLELPAGARGRACVCGRCGRRFVPGDRRPWLRLAGALAAAAVLVLVWSERAALLRLDVGDDLRSARPVSLPEGAPPGDATTPGWIDTPGDVDLFRVEPPRPARLTVGVVRAGGERDEPGVAALAPDGGLVPAPRLAGGTYYAGPGAPAFLRVAADRPGPYRLEVALEPYADAAGAAPGDAAPLAVAPAAPASAAGELVPGGDVDLFRVEGPAGVRLDARVEGLGDLRPRLRVLDADGAVVAPPGDREPEPTVRFRAGPDRPRYLEVRAGPGGSSSGAFRLQVGATADPGETVADAAPVAVADGAFERGGAVGPDDPADVFALTLAEAGWYALALEATDEALDPRLALLDPAGAERAANDDWPAGQRHAFLVREAGAGDVLHAAAQAYAGAGAYTLTVRRLEPLTWSWDGGASATCTGPCWLAVDLPASDAGYALTLTTASPPFPARVTVYDPALQELGAVAAPDTPLPLEAPFDATRLLRVETEPAAGRVEVTVAARPAEAWTDDPEDR